MNLQKMGNGFVASHIWRKLQLHRDVLASQYERTNSFVPNIVWLPRQLSKLTDREGSYAQRFLQYVSTQLYKDVKLQNGNLQKIWGELKDPNIKPLTNVNIEDLNFFSTHEKWVKNRRNKLDQEIDSIINILNRQVPVLKKINVGNYVSSLQERAKEMDTQAKNVLINWLRENKSAQPQGNNQI